MCKKIFTWEENNSGNGNKPHYVFDRLGHAILPLAIFGCEKMRPSNVAPINVITQNRSSATHCLATSRRQFEEQQ